jgi:hypothetical protein
MEASTILDYGVRGNYAHGFFQLSDLDDSLYSDESSRRLRAVVQDFNIKFSREMQRNGQKFSFPQGPSQKKTDAVPMGIGDDESHHLTDMDQPIRLSREMALNWAVKILRRGRGLELPGVFNYQVVSQLFWEQSSKWESFARAHINCIGDVCESFVSEILNSVAAPEVKARLLAHSVQGALKDARMEAMQELQKIVEDMKRQPITYNHYFTDTIQNIQRDKFNHSMNQLVNDSKTRTNVTGMGYRDLVDPNILLAKQVERNEPDMDRFSADQALDVQEAYYKDERKYFVNVITKQVVERHLISKLPLLLSPKMAARLSKEEIEYLAAEPEELASRRLHLEVQLEMLQAGQEAFRKALRGLP